MRDGEAIDDRVFVSLARFEHHRREAGMVWRIRIMLRLHAERVAELIHPAALARDAARKAAAQEPPPATQGP